MLEPHVPSTDWKDHECCFKQPWLGLFYVALMRGVDLPFGRTMYCIALSANRFQRMFPVFNNSVSTPCDWQQEQESTANISGFIFWKGRRGGGRILFGELGCAWTWTVPLQEHKRTSATWVHRQPPAKLQRQVHLVRPCRWLSWKSDTQRWVRSFHSTLSILLQLPGHEQPLSAELPLSSIVTSLKSNPMHLNVNVE